MTNLAQTYPRQRGILGGSAETIVNLTAILTIIGIVMGGAYLVVGKSAATAEWQALDSMVTATKTLYNGELYTNVSLTDLITNKLTGNLRTSGGNAVTNTFGGAITIASSNCNGTAGAGACFTLTSPNIPQSDCISILKQIPVTGYIAVSVNNTALTTFPLTVTAATGACNSTTSNSVALISQ